MLKIERKNTILAIVISTVAIFVPSLIFNKWIEGVVFFICHWFIREQFPKQYHSLIPATCRLITSVVFFFGVSFVLPLSLSLLSALPLAYFVAWIGYIKKDGEDYKFKYSLLKEKLESEKDFNTDTCTKEELIKKCNKLKLSKENTQLAIEFFINKTKQSEIADKLCIDEKSVQQRKQRMKNKLNNKM